jgi:phosphopantothenate-cysteine ligase/phosphopantothenoylcysteine decarboxylase/phosphopantothenate--cysteine ligase
MRILITAGNTQAPIDRVRCITNIFTGRTGAGIAIRAAERGHAVTLLTSHPETANANPNLTVQPYRTFDELRSLMASQIVGGSFESVVHCAAVSDYIAAGVYTSDRVPLPPAGKLKSDASELWLKLQRAPKLVDFIRTEWAFRGVLVKFKLEVGLSDEELLPVAEQSRRHSDADLMVANKLETAADVAYIGPVAGRYERIARPEIPDRLLDAISTIHEARRHG